MKKIIKFLILIVFVAICIPIFNVQAQNKEIPIGSPLGCYNRAGKLVGLIAEKCDSPLIWHNDLTKPTPIPKDTVPADKCPQNGDITKGLVQCGRKVSCEYELDKDGNSTGNIIRTPDPTNRCDFNAIIALVNKIITFILLLTLPIAAIMIAYAGFLYLFSGISDQKSKAKGILTNAVIGLIIAFCAFLIVHFVLKTLGYTTGGWIGF